ncbi:MAG: DUF1292 domain-containing protein [bacterium]
MSKEFDNLENLLDGLDDVYESIDMVDEDGNIVECFVIDGINVDNIQYLLVVNAEDFDDEEAEAFILKQIDEDEDEDEAIYAPVEDDNEYNKVLVLLQENDDTDYEMKF